MITSLYISMVLHKDFFAYSIINYLSYWHLHMIMSFGYELSSISFRNTNILQKCEYHVSVLTISTRWSTNILIGVTKMILKKIITRFFKKTDFITDWFSENRMTSKIMIYCITDLKEIHYQKYSFHLLDIFLWYLIWFQKPNELS